MTTAAQPSFLQHVVYLNPEEKKFRFLGALLASVNQVGKKEAEKLEDDGLIKMNKS